MRSVVRRAQASAARDAVIAVVSEVHDIETVQGCSIRPSQVFRIQEGEDGDLALDLSQRNDSDIRTRATEALAVLSAARCVVPPGVPGGEFQETGNA